MPKVGTTFGRAAGSGGERQGEVGPIETQALGQRHVEALEEHGLQGIGLRHAAQLDLTVRARGQADVVGADALEFLEDGAR